MADGSEEKIPEHVVLQLQADAALAALPNLVSQSMEYNLPPSYVRAEPEQDVLRLNADEKYTDLPDLVECPADACYDCWILPMQRSSDPSQVKPRKCFTCDMKDSCINDEPVCTYREEVSQSFARMLLEAEMKIHAHRKVCSVCESNQVMIDRTEAALSKLYRWRGLVIPKSQPPPQDALHQSILLDDSLKEEDLPRCPECHHNAATVMCETCRNREAHPWEIALVRHQTNCTETEASAVLQKHHNSLVDAILELTP